MTRLVIRLFVVLSAVGLLLIITETLPRSSALTTVSQPSEKGAIVRPSAVPLKPVGTPTWSHAVEPVGRIGGYVESEVVRGEFAYISHYRRIISLNVSDPTHPRHLGQIDITDTVTYYGTFGDLVLVGDYLLVVDYGNGLRVINVSNPRTLVETAFYPVPGLRAIAVSNQYAYLADGGGVKIADVTDPAHLSFTGIYTSTSPATDVAVSGQFVYVTETGAWVDSELIGRGLHIVDVSNPFAPMATGFYSTTKYPYLVTTASHYAYVAPEGGGLHIVDVTDAAHPVESGIFGEPLGILDVAVSGNYAYIADGLGGLRILDASNPVTPTQTGQFYIPDRARSVSLIGHYAFVGSESGGVRILDVANPYAAKSVGVYGPGNALDIALSGDTVFVAGSELLAGNIADPTLPSIIGFQDTSGRVALSGQRAYIPSRDGLHIIDVTNPASPSQLGFFSLSGSPVDVAVADHYAYVAEGTRVHNGEHGGGLHVIDVTDPAAPVETGVYTINWFPRSIVVAGNFAYVIDGSLRVFNVSNKQQPLLVRSIAQGFYDSAEIAIDDNLLYVASGNGIYIYTLVNPSLPVMLKHYALGAGGITVSGNYAYVSATENYGAGLHVLDVSKPSNPVEVAVYLLTGGFRAEVRGNFVYLAAGGEGLEVVWFSPPTSATITTAGGILIVPRDNSAYIYAANTFTGTAIITHTPRFPGNVSIPGDLIGISHAFEVAAVYSDTNQPALPTRPYTMTIQYTDAEKGAAIEDTLALYYWAGGEWVKEPTSSVNVEVNTVTATPAHLSLWTVLGETHRFYLPMLRQQAN